MEENLVGAAVDERAGLTEFYDDHSVVCHECRITLKKKTTDATIMCRFIVGAVNDNMHFISVSTERV